MGELPDRQPKEFWLFPDCLKDEGNLFEFVEFRAEHKTKKGSLVPVFVLLGAANIKEVEKHGDWIISTWNVDNYDELKKLGDVDTWKAKKFLVKPTSTGVTMEVK